MTFPVTYSCGHVGQIELLGHVARDPQKSAQYVSDKGIHECEGCKSKKYHEEHMAFVNAVDNDTKEYGLKPIYGSVRQIEWATKIRRNYVKRIYSIVKADCKHKVDQYVQTLPLLAEDWIAARDFYFCYSMAWENFITYCVKQGI